MKVYRVKKMPLAIRRGIVPVTSPMRGLLDTAAVAPEVVQDGRFTPSELERRARRRDFRKQNRIVIGNHLILRDDWADVVEDADRTAAEIIEAYLARTTLTV